MLKLLLLSALLAQAVPVESRMGRERLLCNGVLLSETLVLTAGHCCPPGSAAQAAGLKAAVIRWSPDLALLSLPRSAVTAGRLEVDPGGAWVEIPIVETPVTGIAATPETGTLLRHRYHDRALSAVLERGARWAGRSVSVGFRPGMSGSGIYRGDALVGIAQRQNGDVTGPKRIRAFLLEK